MPVEPFVGNVLLFGRLLRRAGLPVHHTRLLDAIRALQAVGIRRREDVRAALLALLVHRHEDIARFDAAFALFFRDHTPSSSRLGLFSLGERPRVVARPLPGSTVPVEVEDVGADDAPASDRVVSAYSAAAISRTKDFADFSAAELEEARRALSQLPWRLGRRRTRRWERRGSTAVDLRPVLRRSLTRGELFDLAYRRRRTSPRPIIFIADVSGSMERYSRILLHFAYGLSRHVRHVEAFVFATTLTRITHRVAQRGSERAVTSVIREVTDWGGGTRIGESLRLFNVRWSRRVMRHGPIVLIVSDGWDRGDPAMMARELGRVKRSCRRLIWLNPLLGSASYEPLTRGIQAAMPYIDDFLPAHNLASLEQLADHLSR
jgi:uncharacterized protein with von Willebrand factor type A (vWA) domain